MPGREKIIKVHIERRNKGRISKKILGNYKK